MAIPVYLWLYDDAGNLIKGSVDVQDRESSIEIICLNHCVEIPTDNANGKVTGTRIHSAFCVDKEVDSSSPYLYQALTTGKTLRLAELRFYNINDAGMEEHYFSIVMENVKVEAISSLMYDIKSDYGERCNHLECIELKYEKIKWHYLKGNIVHSDSWNERNTVAI